MSKGTIPVEIAGRVYNIKSTKDNEEYVQNLARMVNEQIRTVVEATNAVDSLRVIDMAALNLADAFCKLQEEYEERTKSLEKERTRLRNLIEKTLNDQDALPDA